MANLIEDLGLREAQQWLNGVCISLDDRVLSIGDIYEDHTIIASEIHADGKTRTARVSGNRLKDWSALSFPPLGYRNFGNDHQILICISRPNTVHRGIQRRDLRAIISGASYALREIMYDPLVDGLREGDGNSMNRMVYELFKPTFIPFKQGLADLLSGRRVQFAINADIAVAPVRTSGFVSVLYRDREIGHITEAGKVEIADTARIIWNDAVGDNQ